MLLIHIAAKMYVRAVVLLQEDQKNVKEWAGYYSVPAAAAAAATAATAALLPNFYRCLQGMVLPWMCSIIFFRILRRIAHVISAKYQISQISVALL